ncbi:MAG: hypothetical protein ABTQ32_36720 [Myxococcaceae bacterium]
MKRVLLLALLASSCLDFERRVTNCFDGGVCSASVSDGGTNTDGGEAFVPFDAGSFCTGEFCWESPFPHGVSLNAVYADGADLMVAGEHGLVAERRGGQWRSFQGMASLTTEWQVLWGTSRDDVWLTGDAKAWHRTASGWDTVGGVFQNANCQGVTGFDGGVFMSAASDVYELNDFGTWDSIFSFMGGDVRQLTTAFGALHGSFRLSTDNGSGQVSRIPNGPAWAFDGGETFSLVGTSNGLLAMGRRAVLLDPTLQVPRELPVVLGSAVEKNGELFGATSDKVGLVTDRGLREEGDAVGVRAMAAGSSVVAVGLNGLILERRDGGWVDPTPTITRSAVVAFVERSGTLFALTADCSLLERSSTTWTKRMLPLPMPNEGCFDAATDGTSLFVLAGSMVAFFDAALALSGFSSLPRGLQVRKLWRSELGALVVTTATDLFVRGPMPTDLFESVRGLGGSGSWGVSGRGSVARVCGLAQDKVADLDLSRSPPVATEVPGLLAHDCRAVLPLRNGQWALATRGGGDLPRVRLVAADGSTADVELDGLRETFIEALVETPKGIAVASDHFAFIPVANPQLLRSSQGFNGITALTVWRGRVFVGGAGGSILQAPAP